MHTCANHNVRPPLPVVFIQLPPGKRLYALQNVALSNRHLMDVVACVIGLNRWTEGVAEVG